MRIVSKVVLIVFLALFTINREVNLTCYLLDKILAVCLERSDSCGESAPKSHAKTL